MAGRVLVRGLTNKKRGIMRIKPLLALLVAALGTQAAASAENYHWDVVAMGGGGYVSGIVPSKSERGIIYARTDVGGAYRWDAANTRWIALTDWVSEADNGLMGVDSLAVDPHNAAKVYLMSGTAYSSGGKSVILRSKDYGKTFAQTEVTNLFHIHGNGMGRGNGEKLQVDPGNGDVLYAGSRDNGLFRSTDAGASWSRLDGLDLTTTPNGNGISFVLLDPTSVDQGMAQRMFIGVSRFDSVGANLYFSYDAGQTFIPVEGGPTGLMPQRAVMSPDGMLYVTYADGAGPHGADGEPMSRGQVWEYDAAGGNWTNITPSEYEHPYAGITMDPANPKHLALSTTNTYWNQGVGYGDQIFTTTDAGRHWTNVVQRGFQIDPMGVSYVAGSSIHWAGSLEFDPFNTKTVWVSSGNGIFRTTNIDAQTGVWGFMVKGVEETGAYDIQSVPNGPLVTVIGDYDGFTQTDPSQYGVRHSPSMGTTTGLAIAAQDSRYMARVGGSLYTSSDGGASWAQTPVFNGTQGNVALSANGLVLLHSPGDGSTTTYRSTNSGASWTPVSGLAVAYARAVADPVNTNKFYAYDPSGKMMASSDGGVSFVLKGSLPSSGSNVIRVAPGHEGDIWVCLNSRGLTRSTDGGATFTKVATVNQCTGMGFGKAAPDSNYPTVYMFGTVGSVTGLMRSTDAGATWVRLNDDAHQYGGNAASHIVTGDMNIYGQVYMSTGGRGVAYAKPMAQGEVVATPVTAGPPAHNGPPNECRYDITASWPGGYIANVTIKNNGTDPINGWTLNWTYKDNSTVQSLWNANLTGNSPSYSASDVGWNAYIAPGNSASFGMVVAGSDIPTLTGDACN